MEREEEDMKMKEEEKRSYASVGSAQYLQGGTEESYSAIMSDDANDAMTLLPRISA